MVLIKSRLPSLQTEATRSVIANLSVFVPSLRIVQTLPSTKTQTAGLKELSRIGLNISDIQVIIKILQDTSI